MLKLSPQSAQGLNKLSNDIQSISKYYLTKRQEKQPEPQSVRYQFSFIDAIKISAYFLLTVITAKTLFLILNW